MADYRRRKWANRITAVSERSFTTSVNDIEHIESQTLAGLSIIKVFFQPNANIPTAIAQIVATEQLQLRQLPPGSLPPQVIKYSASAVPIIQLGLSSPTMMEPALFDAAFNFFRPRLVTIPGVAIPYPYGGKSRLISVDLDTAALLAKGLTPSDIVNAVNAQNLILPSGTVKIGATEYAIGLNGSPDTIAGLNRIPVVTKNGATTFLYEVAHVRDGFSPQTNIVRQNGERGVLDVDHQEWRRLHARHRQYAAGAIADDLDRSCPKSLKIIPLFDQSRVRHGPPSALWFAKRGIAAAAHRHADSGVLGQLAQHLHHCGVHTAVDFVLDHHALHRSEKRLTS